MFTWFSTLKAKLFFWAGLIGLVAIFASGLTLYGVSRMSAQIDTVMAAEQRIQRFSVLANQVGSFLVVAYEAAQSGIDADVRTGRLDGLTISINQSFAQIRTDLDKAMSVQEQSGLDAQSRLATRSLGIARMEALFNATAKRFGSVTTPEQQAGLLGQITAFSIGFDPLLSAAISEERRARDDAITEIGALRHWLSRAALGVGGVVVLLVSGFYLGVVHPQLSRLERLLHASREIERENFAVELPETRNDEIGNLFLATNRMADALAQRQIEVSGEWDRLNQTIQERTEALRTANEALAKTDEDRRRFFADVSHELRTPLTVIMMEAELALKSGAVPDGPMGVIQNRARRLNRRIDDLLRIARSESGSLTLDTAPFNLRLAAEEAVSDMRGPANSAGLEITLTNSADISVVGDHNWVRQVITGLIENCLHYARDGGHIQVTTGQNEEQGWIRVVDNGPGIPLADLDVVMDRFVRGKGSARSEGFGIGLSLARWIITEQNGQITPESPVPAPWRIGETPGTMVTVFLPLDPV